jgi:hypothetical protein
MGGACTDGKSDEKHRIGPTSLCGAKNGAEPLNKMEAMRVSLLARPSV